MLLNERVSARLLVVAGLVVVAHAAVVISRAANDARSRHPACGRARSEPAPSELRVAAPQVLRFEDILDSVRPCPRVAGHDSSATLEGSWQPDGSCVAGGSRDFDADGTPDAWFAEHADGTWQLTVFEPTRKHTTRYSWQRGELGSLTSHQISMPALERGVAAFAFGR